MRISDWSSDVCSSDLSTSEPSGAGSQWIVRSATQSPQGSSHHLPSRVRLMPPPPDRIVCGGGVAANWLGVDRNLYKYGEDGRPARGRHSRRTLREAFAMTAFAMSPNPRPEPWDKSDRKSTRQTS